MKKRKNVITSDVLKNEFESRDSKSSSDRSDKKSAGGRVNKKYGERKSDDRRSSSDKPYGEKKWGDRKSDDRRSSSDKPYGEKKWGDKKSDDRRSSSDKPYGEKKWGDKKSDDRRSSSDKPYSEKKWGDKKSDDRRSSSDKPYGEKKWGDRKSDDRRSSSDKPYGEKKWGDKKSDDRKPYEKRGERPERRKPNAGDGEHLQSFFKENRKKKKEDFKVREDKQVHMPPEFGSKDLDKKVRKLTKEARPLSIEEVTKEGSGEQMPLNKFVSRAGICSRREAVDLIKKSEILVNDIAITEPGYKVQPTDIIKYQDNILNELEKPVYFLLNKPKDHITTTEDPEGRRTVMDLFGEIKERIYPVGRLDRNTTGLLLLTNDGNLAQKLSHPSFKSKKIYQVSLDRDLTDADFDKIVAGLELEDGKALVDSLAFIDPKTKNEIGIEIHIGKNRIVRRIFEHLGYEVKYLDRVMYAGLTKKNLPRGKWRPLTQKEIIFLKHFK